MNPTFKQNLKNWLPQIVIIIALNFIYFYPVLEGKILNQNDIIMGEIKGKEVTDYRAEKGEEPLWRNHLFSGMPELYRFPGSVFTYVHKVFPLLGASGVYIIALIMIGAFIWFRSSKVDPWLSLIGAIAIGFSAFFIIGVGAGHNAKVRTAAYMAPILMSILLVYRGKTLLGLVLTSFFVGLSVFSNHIQVTYYTFIVILCLITTYGVYAFKQKALPDFIKKSILLAVAAFIGVGPNIGRLWTNYVNMKETMRGGGSELSIKENTNKDGLDYDYAMSWSYGIAETANLVFPYSTGGGIKGDYSSTEMYDLIYNSLKRQGQPDKRAVETANQFVAQGIYWGDQSMVHGASYLGAVVFFLFVFSLFAAKDKNKPWVIAAIVIALILAWGKNLESVSHFLFDNLPFYDKFRVPSMALAIIFVLVPYFAFIGVNQFFNQQESKEYYKKAMIKAFGTAAGFGVLFWLIGTSSFTFEGVNDARISEMYKQNGLDFNMLIDDRESLFTASIFKSILYMAITCGLLFIYNQKTIKAPIFLAALGIFILFDLWKFDKDQVSADDFITKRNVERMVQMTAADQVILKDSDPHFRVYNRIGGPRALTGDPNTSYFHKSLGGIHASKLQRYQDIIDFQLSRENINVLNMLNTKWIIDKNAQNQPEAKLNNGAMGNAWFVNEISIAEDANKEMELITNFNPANTVVVNQEYAEYVSGINPSNAGNTISLTEYDNKRMVYKANVTGTEQLAIFSEIYYAPKYQAWKAYINGQEVDHIRVNYLLRGLKIPQGEHEIVFQFEPTTYFVGGKIDLAFSIILLLGVVFVIFKEYKAHQVEE